MKKILMSIRPRFAEKIFTGQKKYEFRRSIFKNKDVKTIVVYASLPIQKVIGEFEIETILHDNIQRLWNKTKEFAGISRSHFFEYFKNKTKGFAIKIKSFRRYEEPLLIKYFNVKPPQSFVYIDKSDDLC